MNLRGEKLAVAPDQSGLGQRPAAGRPQAPCCLQLPGSYLAIQRTTDGRFKKSKIRNAGDPVGARVLCLAEPKICSTLSGSIDLNISRSAITFRSDGTGSSLRRASRLPTVTLSARLHHMTSLFDLGHVLPRKPVRRHAGCLADPGHYCGTLRATSAGCVPKPDVMYVRFINCIEVATCIVARFTRTRMT